MRQYTFHQSDLSEFDFCLERGAASYYDETPRIHTDSTVHGSAFHAGIEATLREKAEGRSLLHLGDMVEAYVMEARSIVESSEVRWNKFTNIEDLVPVATKGYANWLAEVEPFVHPQPTLIEKVLSARFSDNITLEGTPDAIDFQGVIWDWKTGTRPYAPWEKQRWAIQPTVYAFLAHANGLCPLPITFRYAIMLNDGKLQQLLVTRTAEHFSWLGDKLNALVTVLESGQRPLPLNDTGWWCSPDWCANWDNCKGSHHGGDDWKMVTKLD